MKTHRKDRGMQVKQFGFKADAVNDDGTFTGYGSVFGNVDSYREVVAPGAFKESLERWRLIGDPMPALWQHRSGEPIGGYDRMEEDDHGLALAGFLMIGDIARADEAFALMKRRVVKGLSIGYFVEESTFDEKERIRTLTKLDLVEVSIVTFPANPEAQIDAIKSKLAHGGLPTLREFEEILREQGFSKSQAAIVASRGLKHLLDRGDSGGDGDGDVLSVLKNFRLTI